MKLKKNLQSNQNYKNKEYIMCETLNFKGPENESCRALFNAVVALLDSRVTSGDPVFGKLSKNIINNGGSTSMRLSSNNVTAVKVACIDGHEGVHICLCQDYWRMRNGGKDESMQIFIQPVNGEDVYKVECPKPSPFICKRVDSQQDAEDFMQNRIARVLEIL